MADFAIIKKSTLISIADAIREKRGITGDTTTGASTLDYIESTGSEYINTKYKFTSDKVRIFMVVENLNVAGTNHALCGSENSGYSGNTSDSNGWLSPTLFAYTDTGEELHKLNICGSAWVTDVSVPKGARHTVEVETFGDGTGRVAVDGIETTFSYVGHMERQYDFYIGANNLNGTVSAFSVQRTCCFQMWDNDVLVRDYEPRIDENGIIGLYDKVEEEMYPNAGSGGFIAGSVISTGGDEVILIPTASMAEEILAIETGTDLSATTLKDGSQLLYPLTAYDAEGNLITGTIPTKTQNDLTVSGAQVKVPAGYYETLVTKSVATTGLGTPTISVDANGKITATVTHTTSGYVEADSKSATKQLTTQAAKTVTPSTSAQTAVASGTYTTGDVKVAALTDYGTITPGTSENTYTGKVTIAGDSNLKDSNIKSGVSIFGVDGTMKGYETRYCEATSITQTTVTFQFNGVLSSIIMAKVFSADVTPTSARRYMTELFFCAVNDNAEGSPFTCRGYLASYVSGSFGYSLYGDYKLDSGINVSTSNSMTTLTFNINDGTDKLGDSLGGFKTSSKYYLYLYGIFE